MTSIMCIKLVKLRKLEVIYYPVTMKMKMNNEIKSYVKLIRTAKGNLYSFFFYLLFFGGFYCNLEVLIARKKGKCSGKAEREKSAFFMIQ
jgi:hypothetical protein